MSVGSVNKKYAEIQQASGGNHNLIALCREEGMTQQEAYNRAGELLKDRYRAWYIAQSELPQWGEEVDVQVQKYIKGCQDTILANMNWRYVPIHHVLFCFQILLR